MQTETIPTCTTKHKRGQYTGKLVQNKPLGQEYRSFVVEIKGDGAKAFFASVAGQFVQVNCNNPSASHGSAPFLNRPFSIASIKGDDTCCQVEVIHNILGPGTTKMSQIGIDSDVELVGPLGNGYTLPTDKSAPMILIGGGVGVPPLIFLANQLANANYTNVTLLIGMRSVTNFDQCIDTTKAPTDPLTPALLLEQVSKVNVKCVIATDDGSLGYKGSIVTAMDDMLKANKLDKNNAQLFTCGPEGMLKAVVNVGDSHSIASQVCMEAYMACGFGVCQSCIVTTKIDANKEASDENQKYELVCHHGPVFDSKKLCFA